MQVLPEKKRLTRDYGILFGRRKNNQYSRRYSNSSIVNVFTRELPIGEDEAVVNTVLASTDIPDQSIR